MTQPAAPLSESKTCTKCGETKPLDEFNRHPMGRLGRRSQCRQCLAQKYQENRSEVLAKQAVWRDANREVKQERDRAYHARNRERLNAQSKEYRDRNRDLIRARDRAWRAANIETRRAGDRRYYAQNADRIKAYRSENIHTHWASSYRARAKVRGFKPVVEDFTKADVIAAHGDACAYCGGPFEHLDHAIPISKGGPHTLANVRPSCAECNVVKSDRTPEEWQAEQDALADLTPEELDALIDDEVRRWSTSTTNQGDPS